jgi:Na+-translocating ferredoxin:NAD+ oxidoreductase RnfC subunit
MYEYRRTPLKQLMQRLGIEEYNRVTPFRQIDGPPTRVTIPLSQHIGSPAQAIVDSGQRVQRGELIADIPPGKLGARLHASISGVVKEVNGSIVIESQG